MIKKLISAIFFVLLLISGDTKTIDKYCDTLSELKNNYCKKDNAKYCDLIKELNDNYCANDSDDDNAEDDEDEENKAKGALILQQGKLIDKKDDFKAIVYDNEYYFYYNDELLTMPDYLQIKDDYVIAPDWITGKNKIYEYYPIGVFEDWNEDYPIYTIVFNFSQKKFVGKKHNNMSHDTYIFSDVYMLGNKSIVVIDEYEKDDNIKYKYGLMSTKDGHMILENLDKIYYVDSNDNVVVPNKNGSTLYSSEGKVLLKYDDKDIYSTYDGKYIVTDEKTISVLDNNLKEIDLKSLKKESYYFYGNWPGYSLNYCKKSDSVEFQFPESPFGEYKCSKDSFVLVLNNNNRDDDTECDFYSVSSVDNNTGKLTNAKMYKVEDGCHSYYK